MPGYFSHGKRLFEFTTVSTAGDDDYVVECIELSRQEGGFAGQIVVAPAGDVDRSFVRFWPDELELPLEVLRYWLSILPDPFGPEDVP